jgi:hypothetical protein
MSRVSKGCSVRNVSHSEKSGEAARFVDLLVKAAVDPAGLREVRGHDLAVIERSVKDRALVRRAAAHLDLAERLLPLELRVGADEVKVLAPRLFVQVPPRLVHADKGEAHGHHHRIVRARLDLHPRQRAVSGNAGGADRSVQPRREKYLHAPVAAAQAPAAHRPARDLPRVRRDRCLRRAHPVLGVGVRRVDHDPAAPGMRKSEAVQPAARGGRELGPDAGAKERHRVIARIGPLAVMRKTLPVGRFLVVMPGKIERRHDQDVAVVHRADARETELAEPAHLVVRVIIAVAMVKGEA